ncbi:unnamed protein product [Didymodactylos carnosus]|uniref:GDP-fucose protein O-fucosyltransferase 1 n=1 Tax=Didymodactylos carnosus TaxID=1234261 RepID=A0A8S2CYL4_9BILA|nr:unnamed protein product [Didymodactylos carnosus]CAF3552659.1 unnamed protein product [Didymodactylos carnosus]
MGRFGNQAEQFLGALAFTRILNRTLVLPHWIEYPQRAAGSFQVPFDRYFEVEPLESYLKVILMDDFMKYLANDVWPKGQRIVFCYTSRKNEDNQSEGCNAKEGNPFGPFWDKFSIDFDQDVFYHPLYFDISSAGDWNNRYPPSKYPVLAFTGPPGAFPAEQRHVHLAKYFIYSNYIKKKAENFLKKHAPKYNQTNLLAIHLRNGIDFKRACEYVIPKSNFFASAQCLGYSLEKGIVLSSEICYPSRNTIIKQVEHAVITHKPDYLFVAADEDHMIQQFQKTLEKKYNVSYQDF